MKVILIEKVPTLGNVGEIVKVKEGHARNYLFPKKLAVLADERKMAQIENQKRKLKKKVDAEKNSALSLKKQIEGLELEFIKRVGNNGKLFGAVTGLEISKEFENKGIVGVERRLIVLDTPIKGLGKFSAKVKLFTGVEAKCSVKVIMDPKQAEELKAGEKQGKKKRATKADAKGEDLASDLKDIDISEDQEVKITTAKTVSTTTAKKAKSEDSGDDKKATKKAKSSDDDKGTTKKVVSAEKATKKVATTKKKDE